MELLAASVAGGSFFRRRKKAHQRTKRCPAIRDCNATKNIETASDRCWINVVSWTVSRRPKWFLLLVVVLCWSILCIHQAHPVEALLSAVAPSHRHCPHNKFWGVAVRGGGDGTPVDSTDADCHNNNNNSEKDSPSFRTHGLPHDLPRWDDVTTAIAAVRKACAVTVALQPVHDDAAGMEMTKEDASPVTVADLAVQAVVLHHLLYHHPSQNNHSAINTDGFIAEEDTSKLRQSPALCQRVADAAQLTTAQVLHAIDAGQSHLQWTTTATNSSIVSSSRPRRVWCLDPIDGTRGFLRGRRTGGQYAVALALLEDGVPVIGVLGCPNLPHNDTTTTNNLNWSNDETDETSSAHRGCLFVASQGGGCYQLSVPSAPCRSEEDTTTTTATTPRRLHVTSTGSIRHGRFCIGVESYSDAQGQTVKMAQLLHGPEGVLLDKNNTIVRARRMDSQAKHGVVARGGAEWYVRLPKPGYVEWIWDHAAGFVVATEAGGTVTDTRGRPLDFSLGAQLSPDVQGVLMSSGGKWHDALVQAYGAVVDQDNAAAAAATKSEGDRL